MSWRGVIIINTQNINMDKTQDIHFSSKSKLLIDDQILNIQKNISKIGIEGETLRSKEGANLSSPSDSKSQLGSK